MHKKIFLVPFLVMYMLCCSIAGAEVHVATTADNPLSDNYSIVPADDALPKVTARSAVVIEAKTGKVLYERNMEQLRYPASTTKMMTLILALENSQPDEIVTTGKNAYNAEGSTLWLEEGEQMTMESLEYGIMLVSGNDATIAIAEHIAGSVPKFAEMMTKKAHDIGANSTNFTNCNGLPDPNHYTTAYDLAKIAAYGYNHVPGFEKIVSTQEWMLPPRKNPDTQFIRNENLLLYIYNGCNGVKTGYTDAAGRCVVTAAKRNGIQLISVVLDGLYMWNDSIAMLDYGFSQVYPYTVLKKDEVFSDIQVNGGDKDFITAHIKDDVVVGCQSEEKKLFIKKIILNENLQAPVNKGDVIGQVAVLRDGKEVFNTELIADESVAKVKLTDSVEQNITSYIAYLGTEAAELGTKFTEICTEVGTGIGEKFYSKFITTADELLKNLGF